MSTKENLLELFEKNKGIYFSGEELAEKLNVSRTAIWKAVKGLRNDGYSIDAITNKGYCLSVKTDILSPQGIYKYLDEKYQDKEITVFQTIDSTNTYLKKNVTPEMPEGYTVMSNEQTKGRGRYTRSFYSPNASGVYMSILLRPSGCSAQQALSITTMAGVAMCDAINEVTNKKAQIKWVNDIFVDGKKVCGILTEGSFNIETNSLDYAILGIGTNIYKPEGGFPEDIKNIAGAISDTMQSDLKNKIASTFLNKFFNYYYSADNKEYIEKYKAYNFILDREITVIKSDEQLKARALEIDDECRLIVEYPNGDKEALSHGEISIKL